MSADHILLRKLPARELPWSLLLIVFFLLAPLNAGAQTAAASNSGPICAGADLILYETGGSAVSWLWSTSGKSTFNDKTLQNPTVKGAVNGEVFTVTVTDENNNKATASTTVIVYSSEPSKPGSISGNTSPCQGATGIIYSVSPVAKTTSYFWEVPSGWTITDGQGTTSITVSVGPELLPGTVRVSGINSCGTGDSRNRNVTVIPGPAPIEGPATLYIGSSATLTDATTGGVWSSKDTAVAVIGPSTGTVTGISAGTSLITYTLTSGCSVSTTVTVLPVQQQISFPLGWSWFSVNVTTDDMSVKSLLGSCATDGDYIKDQVSSATYYEGTGWWGSLKTLTPGNLYKIRTNGICDIVLSGSPAVLTVGPFNFVTGWNWFGYTLQNPMPLGTALASLSLSHLDYIKNQTGSSTWYEGSGWFGTLKDLLPAEGYMIRLAKPGTLTFPGSPALKNSVNTGIFSSTDLNPAQFEYNGSVTAGVMLDGVRTGSESDLLFAYINGQISGIASGLQFGNQGTFLFPLMINSNSAEGQTVMFKFYDAAGDVLLECDETMVFRNDMIIASAVHPLILNFSARPPGDPEETGDHLKLSAYPNPFSSSLNIEYYLPESTHVSLSLFDAYGRLMNKMVDQVQEAGSYSLDWVPEHQAGGAYIILLSTGKEQTVRRVTLIR